MEAYYYSFEPTGVRAVDEILSAVARAGKAFHHTKYWSDPAYNGESSCVDIIQKAAWDCAALMREGDNHSGKRYVSGPERGRAIRGRLWAARRDGASGTKVSAALGQLVSVDGQTIRRAGKPDDLASLRTQLATLRGELASVTGMKDGAVLATAKLIQERDAALVARDKVADLERQLSGVTRELEEARAANDSLSRSFMQRCIANDELRARAEKAEARVGPPSLDELSASRPTDCVCPFPRIRCPDCGLRCERCRAARLANKETDNG